MTKEFLTQINHEDLKIGMIVTQLGFMGKEEKLISRKHTITQKDIDSKGGLFYLDSRRTKTISKNFYDREILAKLPDNSLYLKMGVKRQNYQDDLDYNNIHQFLQDDGIYHMSDIQKRLKKDEEY